MKWISTIDKKPEKDRELLVYWGCDVIDCISYAFYDPIRDEFFTDNGYTFSHIHVTDWIYLQDVDKPE